MPTSVTLTALMLDRVTFSIVAVIFAFVLTCVFSGIFNVFPLTVGVPFKISHLSSFTVIELPVTVKDTLRGNLQVISVQVSVRV